MEVSKIKVLRPALFSPYENLRCGVSTRCGGVSPSPYHLNMSMKVGDAAERVTKNREIFFRQLGISPDLLAMPNQVHSSNVQKVSEPGIYDACDGLITNRRNVFLTVTVADCVPLLMYDPAAGAVGALHAGWRGSKLKIVTNAVNSMIREFGCDPKNLVAYIGPSAGACCYEVGPEIAEQFDAAYVIRRSGCNPHLDMRAIQADLFIEAGVRQSNIEVSRYCTICVPDLFHSYRRLGPDSGRMMGVIGIIR